MAVDPNGGFVFDAGGNYLGGGGADAGIFNGDTQLSTAPGSGWAPAAPAAAVNTGPTAAQIAASNAAAANARTANAINAGFGQVIGNYDTQLGDIPGQIDAAGNLVNSQYDSQGKSIKSAYDVGNGHLQFARDQLDTQTKRSIQKLASNIRQSFDSYSTMIGAGGGGDSSAPGQLSYALQKAEAQNRTDIFNNTADQNGQIGQQQTTLDAQHSDQMQKLDSWKAQQVISIGQQFHQLQQQIETAKAGANKDKLLALASLNTDAVNQAISALSGVTATHQQTAQAINDHMASLSAPGNPDALSATNYAVAAGPGIQTPGYSADSTTPAPGGDSFAAGAVPYYKKLATA